MVETRTEQMAATLPVAGGSATTPPTADAPMTVAHYRLARLLGTGAMGAVWEAFDQRLGREVAIKLLSTPRGEALRRFELEGRHSARLRHPNIVPVHDVGGDDKRRWLVMDLVRGGSLADLLPARAWTWRQRARLVEKIARAVQYAHEQGVVHRDLKPANVLIETGGTAAIPRGASTDDAIGEPRVVDFGLAKDLRADAGLSEDGNPMGTPAYMPPEQALGHHDRVGPRSDVYGLGAILYELLTGRAPFVGENPVTIMRAVVSDEPPEPHALAPGLPADLETICVRCLAKAPLRRYATAGAVADELAAWLAGEPISARPVGRAERLARRVRKNPAAYAIGVGAVAVLVAVVGVFLWSLDQRRREAERALGELRMSQDERARLESQKNRRWRLVRAVDLEHAARAEAAIQVVGRGRHEYTDGGLHAWGGEPQLAVVREPIAGDIAIEFDCREDGDYLNDASCFLGLPAIPEPGAGLAGCYEFKYGGWDNTRSLIARDGHQLCVLLGEQLVAGRTYHVRAERIGARLTYAIDGTTVFDVVDDAPLASSEEGYVGLYGFRAHTYWSNLKVWHLDEPESADLLEIADRMRASGQLEAAEALYREVAAATTDAGRRDRARAGIVALAPMAQLRRDFPELHHRLRALWPRATVSLSPHGMVIDADGQGIEDLEPLRGIAVSVLHAPRNRIADLGPLAGAPLRDLDLRDNRITDLRPLAGAPLIELRLDRNRLRDLAPLAGMPLTLLNIDGTGVSDLSPLKGMPLRTLSCAADLVVDLAPLARMPLQSLNCSANAIESLAPLAGLSLSTLDCSVNRIASLAPLSGLRLWLLRCDHNRIDSLAPLAKNTPRVLICGSNRIASLAPLAGRAITLCDAPDNPITSIAELIPRPPAQLNVDADRLPQAEVDTAIAAWDRTPATRPLSLSLRVERALTRGDGAAARALSTPFAGHRYLLVSRERTWSDAERAAAAVGGHLVTIGSAEEHAFVHALASSSFSSYWIGLRSRPSPQWVTGEPFGYDAIAHRVEIQAGAVFHDFNHVWEPEAPELGTVNQLVIEWDDQR